MGSKRAENRPKLKIADVAPVAGFKWTEENSATAVALAEGKTQQEVANECGISTRTIQRWLCDTEFAAEVDRLSLMVGIASRAERLRLAQRVIRQKTVDGTLKTDKDLLEWVKFAQSETDGAKLDLAAFAAAFSSDEAPVADEGQAGSGRA